MGRCEIKQMEKEMVLQATIELDKHKVREDFMGLYNDIACELAEKAPEKERLIYEYTSLMDKEQEIYVSFDAYEAGAFAGYGNDDDHESLSKAFTHYIASLHIKPENIKVLEQRDFLYWEICNIMGDTYRLMIDFNDLYRKCNGIVCSNLSVFFNMGYNKNCYKKLSVG